ncbi:uncharacterized protein LOC131885813 [Tigriopus californicus]|uniref:uncharacterized protein LOC131885813 n=1 Tax=Tigriopus californicus TaxID=6832 RepID=UPI0027D9FF0D|nr:uncharacterized protein LOC131885813 [Tigriopus californicus]
MGYRGSNLAVCFILFIALPLLSILIEARKSKLIQSNKAVSDRTGKLFSLFNVVKFENEACVTQSDQTMRGTCFSQATCQEKGGRADGNCASGFGVCCMFAIRTCGGTVVQNCTYIQNTGFPAASNTVSQTCNYMFDRIDANICQVRLDFDTTVLRTDPGLAGMCGGAGDSLQVGSPFSPSRFAFPPTVCGTLTGQHMYIESARTGNTAGSLAIQTGTALGDRRYKIKVTYVDCQSRLRAPSGCAQFFTGVSGTITSYNFQGGEFLRNQDYTHCIRQEEGFCQFQLYETPGVPDAFSVSENGNGQAQVQICKNRNFVTVPSMAINPNGIRGFSDYRCGMTFSSQSGDTTPGALLSTRVTPFRVQVHTLKADDGNQVTFANLKGFSLDYNQIPC